MTGKIILLFKLAALYVASDRLRKEPRISGTIDDRSPKKHSGGIGLQLPNPQIWGLCDPR